MKNLKLLLLIAFSVTLFCKCNKDDSTKTLNYDGNNFAAPFFDPVEVSFCVKFTTDKLEEFKGESINRIGYYVETPPQKIVLNLYNESSSNQQPSGLIYTTEINNFSANAWNFHDLDLTLSDTDEVFWIEIVSTHSSLYGSIGCDQGPAVENSDLMMYNEINSYITYREFTNQEVSVNWNIRAYFDEE